MSKAYPWKAIEDDFSHGLILDNGASIALDPRFAYPSLKGKASDLGLITADVQRVFNHLNTADFELVLRMLWHASKINQALDIPDTRTTRAYESVRDALIEVVRAIHVPHDEVRSRLGAAAAFMSRFSTVLSLSYDVLVYWAILFANEESPNRFKDCFVGGAFQQDWQKFRKPYGSNSKATLVFYPQGNLALAANLAGLSSRSVQMPELRSSRLCSLSGALRIRPPCSSAKAQPNKSTPLSDAAPTSPRFTRKSCRMWVTASWYSDGRFTIMTTTFSMRFARVEHVGSRSPSIRTHQNSPNSRQWRAGSLQIAWVDRNKFEVALFDRASSGSWVAP